MRGEAKQCEYFSYFHNTNNTTTMNNNNNDKDSNRNTNSTNNTNLNLPHVSMEPPSFQDACHWCVEETKDIPCKVGQRGCLQKAPPQLRHAQFDAKRGDPSILGGLWSRAGKVFPLYPVFVTLLRASRVLRSSN